MVAELERTLAVVMEFVDETDGVAEARAGQRNVQRSRDRLAPRVVIPDEFDVSVKLPFLGGVERLPDLAFHVHRAGPGLFEEGHVFPQHKGDVPGAAEIAD